MASIVNTSVSGRLNWTKKSHGRWSSSTQCVPSYFTMSPTWGMGIPSKFVVGAGSGGDTNSVTTVVRLPVLKPAAYTVEPSGVTASARGVSVNRVMMLMGPPLRSLVRALAS